MSGITAGLSNLKTRLEYIGSDPASRITNGKLRSLRSALINSYQSTEIVKLSDGETYQCLINPDQLKPDYDNKMISVSGGANFNAGDTFYWPANNTYWLVYLQELTETAYFRGYIRRCRYILHINNVDYYVYVQGPTQTDIQWSQKGGFAWNKLNHTLLLYVSKTEDSLAFFKRFAQIELDGQTWRVTAVDNISIEGVIEVSVEEYFNNSLEGLEETPELVVVDTSSPHIVGAAFVKPYDVEDYLIALASGGTWSVSNEKAVIDTSDSTSATVRVVSGKSGSFDLVYTYSGGSITLTIYIESL